MTLRISIVDPGAVPPGFESSVELDEGSITIGRAPDNDLVLADSARQLSKWHCRIEGGGGAYTLTDTSANGVFMNGAAERVGRDQTVALNPGDSLRIGEYELVAEIAEGSGAGAGVPAGAADSDSTMVAPSPFGGGAPKPAAAADDPFGIGDDDDFEDVGADLGVDVNPFDDPPRRSGGSPPQHRASGPPLPLDDFDDAGDRESGESLLPHGPEGTLYAKAGSLGQDSGLNPFDDGDDEIGEAWDQPPMPDDVPSQNQQFTPPKVTAEQKPDAGAIPDDWDLDDLGADMGADLGGDLDAPPDETASPFLAPSDPPPAQPAPPAQPRPAAPQPQPASAGGGGVADAAALRVFLEGAGLGRMKLSEDQAIQLMRDAGHVFRRLVAGLQEALATRAEIKDELDVSRTMIGRTSNNPLKLGLSEDEAVVAMLRQPGGGFLSPTEAVDQGFQDIQAHQMATMAAMHLALRRLLEKFDPKALEQRLEERSMLGNLLPAARKSKYWELFCDFYASIAGDAESEFHEFFTKQFSEAYEEQSKKLR